MKKPEFSLEQVTKILIYSLVFLIPLFFGFGNINVLDFNKQILLIVFGLAILALWFLRNIIEGKFKIQLSWLNLASLIFIVSSLTSSILARWPWGSFWGWPLHASSGSLTLILMFAFYLVASHVFGKKEMDMAQILVLISGGIVAILGIVQVFGATYGSLAVRQVTDRLNTVGATNSWALFLGGILPLAVAITLESKSWRKIVASVASIVAFIGLILTNYSIAWIEVMVGMFIFLVLGLNKAKEPGFKFLLIPSVILSLALIIGVFQFPLPGLPSIPIEVSPTFMATFNTVKGMVMDSTKDMVFGWGPGTFKYGWSMFKDSSLNQTVFWNVRFSSGQSQILESVGTTGIIGTLSFLGLIGYALYQGLKSLGFGDRLENDPITTIGAFSSFTALSVVKFLHSSNLTLDFLWWFFLIGVSTLAVKKVKSFKLEVNSKSNFIFSFVAILILIGSIFLVYLEGTRYWGEVKYVKALQSTEFNDLRNNLLQAIRLNPEQEIFWQALTQAYIIQTNNEMIRTDISDEEKVQSVSNLVANSVATSKKVTELNPHNVVNWQVRGETYRDIIGWSKGSYEWATTSYEKAMTLEPNNPFHLVELGKVNYVQSQTLEGAEKQAYIDKALDYYKQATDLKPDYAQAFYQTAIIQEAQGQRGQAIATLEGIKNMSTSLIDYNPLQDVGLAFQLGLLYYFSDDYTNAIPEFERAVSLSPGYSNARYFLGIIYDARGRTGDAIEQFEAIRELNPEDQEISQIVSNLENGKSALSGIATDSETVPVDEETEEK